MKTDTDRGRPCAQRVGLVGVAVVLAVLQARAIGGDGDGEKSPVSQRGAAMKVDAEPALPDVIAVRVRHDMCPYCRKFDPQFPKLVRQMKDKSVLFVTLDLTSEATQQQAALLTGALGLDEFWTGDLSKVGSITFLDGKSKKVLSSRLLDSFEEVAKDVREACDATRE